MTLMARGRTLERLTTEGLTAPKGPTTPSMHIDDVNATDNPTAVGPVDVVIMAFRKSGVRPIISKGMRAQFVIIWRRCSRCWTVLGTMNEVPTLSPLVGDT